MTRSTRSILGALALSVCIFFVTMCGGFLFVHFFPKNAAIITDTLIRPVLGPRITLFLEHIFFDLTDHIITQDQPSVQITSSNEQMPLPQITIPTSLNITPLTPIIEDTLTLNEGIWIDRPLASFPNQSVFATTSLRTDPERPHAHVTIAQIDLQKIGLGIVAGKKEPGGPIGNPGTGTIPQDIIKNDNLIAAFSGGFQYRDGAYGMIVGHKTYVPLQKDLGTIIGHDDSSVEITRYTDQTLTNNSTFVRQNCPLLIENGVIMPDDISGKELWSHLDAHTNELITWRSGIGLTHNGMLIYAVGNSLTPSTLARALQHAGATNALQLDINPIWVRFNIYDSLGSGIYRTQPLQKDLFDGGTEYLTGYDKDFFYLYKK